MPIERLMTDEERELLRHLAWIVQALMLGSTENMHVKFTSEMIAACKTVIERSGLSAPSEIFAVAAADDGS